MKLSKLSKNKKIILSLLTIGVLTTFIIIPILVLNNQKSNDKKINKKDDLFVDLLKGSRISNGLDGKIFQDSFKNLWAIGKDQKLQVLKKDPNKEVYVNSGWTSDTSLGLTKNSNIINGIGGTIFQDEFKNLWSMGKDSKLQVLKVNPNSSKGYVDSWINK